MLYHYTDRLTARDIRRDGAIRPERLTLHRDMMGTDRGKRTAPIIWLTTATDWEPTVAAKLIANGWPRLLIGELYRFVLADSFPCVGLDEYIQSSGIDSEWWRWMVMTGAMSGADVSAWRIATTPIEKSDWLDVQRLMDRGFQWGSA